MDLRVIWIWVPKNAGGTISRELMRVHGERAVVCNIPLDTMWRLNPELKGFRTVAFKRNPYTRIVSCWLNKLVALPDESYFRRYRGLQPRMPFADFAEWLNTDEGS